MHTTYRISQKLILSVVLLVVISILSSSFSKAQCTYCSASTTYEDEGITEVIFGDIDVTSGWQGGVADNTSKSTDIKVGSQYSITVKNGLAVYSSDQVAAFIDWNHDCDLTDGNEQFNLSTSDGGATYTGSITVPSAALGGTTRMRVRMTYSSTPTPCGSSSYGEIEDYSVYVILPAPDAGVAAIIPPTSPYVEGTYPVKMTLGSYGDADLGRCTIHWSVNGVEFNSYYWSGPLKKDQTQDITLGNYDFIYPEGGPFDPFTIRVWLTDIVGDGTSNPDANSGNDDKNIKTKPSTEDAQPVAIVQPSGSITPGKKDVVIRVRNNARKPLTVLDIDWYVDGTKIGTKKWFGYLAQNETADVLVGSYDFQFKTPLAPFAITAITSNPNAVVDPVPANDTLIQNVAPSLVAGNYSIGGSAAHFPDMTSAINYLNASGIAGDGDVILNINPGTYNEQFVINDFSHGNNHFYFRSANGYASDVKLTYSTTVMNNYIMEIDGLNNITFENLTFIANDGGAGTIIEANSSDNLSFQNVIFEGVKGAPVFYQYSLIRYTDCYNLNFNNCQFNKGFDAIEGYIYGIEPKITIQNSKFQDYTGFGVNVNTNKVAKIQGQKSKDNKILNGDPGPSIVIDGNTFSGSDNSPYGGVYLQASAQVTNNTFSGFSYNPSGSGSQGAIILEHSLSGAQSIITNNTINNMNSVSGISIMANDVIIEANQVGIASSSINTANGMYLEGNNITVNYNKVNVTTMSSNGYALQTYNANGIIANNLFVNLGAGSLYANSNTGLSFYYNTIVSNSTMPAAEFVMSQNEFKRNLVANYGTGQSALIISSSIKSQENAIYTKGATNGTDLTNWVNLTGDNTTVNVPLELTDDGTYQLTKFYDPILTYTPLGIPSEYEQFDYYGLERAGYYYAGYAGIILDITVTRQPESILACNGEQNQQIRVAATITYGAEARFQWQKDGVDIPGATDPILKFPTFDYNTTGTFRVRIYGPANTAPGIYSDEVLVYTLRPTEITRQPESIEAALGETVHFTVEAHTKGITPPYFQHRYQWYRVINGIETQLMDNEYYANTRSPILTITNLQDLHFSGNVDDYYFVEVEGQCGTIRSDAVRLNMTQPTIIFDIQPETQNVCLGNSATFTGQASSQIDEQIAYQWYYDGNVIIDDAKYSGAKTNTLTVFTVVPSDTGKYTLEATGEISGAKRMSDEVTIILNSPAVFTQQPPETLTITEGDELTLSVVAEGTEPMTYQWMLNDTPIEGATSPTLIIADVIPANHSGFYRCEATNLCGTSSSTACQVQVEPKGGITSVSDPQNIALQVNPNPANSNLNIAFNSENETNIEVSLNDITGRIMFSRIETANAGTNNLQYNVSNLTSGTYFVTIKLNGNVYAKQIVIMK
ncbi:MAG: immunoglobulin domain-containing protein [Chloroherpetonaceae bacterium]